MKRFLGQQSRCTQETFSVIRRKTLRVDQFPVDDITNFMGWTKQKKSFRHRDFGLDFF